MERNTRKFFTGTVVSDKMNKTIVVSVDTFGVHKLYKKRVKNLQSFMFMMKTTQHMLVML